ncbi:MAG: hypothetical protein IJ703_00265 [Eubacterium sp.]|nr:hypothetical protein [Eubacterium sp.]
MDNENNFNNNENNNFNNNDNNYNLDHVQLRDRYGNPINRPADPAPNNMYRNNTTQNNMYQNNMTDPIFSTNTNPPKTKVSRSVIILVVVCLLIGGIGVGRDLLRRKREPKRVAGYPSTYNVGKKVPANREEFFYLDGEGPTEDVTEEPSTEQPDPDNTGDGTIDDTDDNTVDDTDDNTVDDTEDNTVDDTEDTEDTGEDSTSTNPFDYIYEQSGIDDQNQGSDDESGKTYGKHDVYETMVEAGEYLMYLVDKGATGMAEIFISKKIGDQFSTIQTGFYFHSIYANLSETYYWNEVNKDVIRIRITITRSDCGYVYRNIVYGEEIPEDRKNAIALREEVEKVYNEVVTPGMSDFEIELALHDRLISTVKYIGADSPYDVQHSAYGALVNHEAVCDGYSKAFSLLLTRAGIENKVVYGSAGSGKHAWSQVKIDDVWYMVDSTWDDPEYSSVSGTAFHPYFNVSDSFLSKDHHWEKEMFYECPSMDENYFNHYGYVYRNQKDYEAAMKERIEEGGAGIYESVLCEVYSVDNSFIADIPGDHRSEYYDDILNDYYFSNIIIK